MSDIATNISKSSLRALTSNSRAVVSDFKLEYEVKPKKEERKVRNIKKRRGIQLILAKIRHNGVRRLFK